jgi:phthiodiolone/phenolphthiodiolone dimycocerosates ketoreductase
VWVAGNAPATLALAGRVADGWLTAAKSPAMVREDLAAVRAEAGRIGRDPDAITPALFAYTVIDRDAERAGEIARGLGKAILLWWRGSLTRLGLSLGADDLTVSSFDGSPEATARWLEAAGQVPDEAVEELLVFGTPSQVAARLQAFADAGIRHIVVVCLDGFGDLARWRESAELLAEDVLPALR